MVNPNRTLVTYSIICSLFIPINLGIRPFRLLEYAILASPLGDDPLHSYDYRSYVYI